MEARRTHPADGECFVRRDSRQNVVSGIFLKIQQLHHNNNARAKGGYVGNGQHLLRLCWTIDLYDQGLPPPCDCPFLSPLIGVANPYKNVMAI